ncbi:hypothetical protein ACE1OC_41270 [Streptomyces sp. DSM 116496]|uniref:hypothetical protein n=1 Tax=Streptomyces stoeckheimensis TaxID=3344656 RepID=UPI0038B245F9
MTAHPSRPAAVTLALLAALAAGCSTTTTGKNGGTTSVDPSAAAADRARSYMRAVVADDWSTACSLMSAEQRTACHERHPVAETPDPDGPALGPVLLDRPPIRVPGTSVHPDGWGVIVSYTVAWPGKRTLTERIALRMTDAAGEWWVDQREDVADSDLTAPEDPALAALARVVR